MRLFCRGLCIVLALLSLTTYWGLFGMVAERMTLTGAPAIYFRVLGSVVALPVCRNLLDKVVAWVEYMLDLFVEPGKYCTRYCYDSWPPQVPRKVSAEEEGLNAALSQAAKVEQQEADERLTKVCAEQGSDCDALTGPLHVNASWQVVRCVMGMGERMTMLSEVHTLAARTIQAASASALITDQRSLVMPCTPVLGSW
jgi:hypothetical protein